MGEEDADEEDADEVAVLEIVHLILLKLNNQSEHLQTEMQCPSGEGSTDGSL